MSICLPFYLSLTYTHTHSFFLLRNELIINLLKSIKDSSNIAVNSQVKCFVNTQMATAIFNDSQYDLLCNICV